MSLVFLDVDGVLNHSGCYRIYSAAQAELTLEQQKEAAENDLHVDKLFDQKCVAVLNQITTAANADIVLSSSWRMWFWNKRDRFRELFEKIGVKAKVIDFTPRRGTGGLHRGDEIVTWLKEHCEQENILVLDDDWDLDAVKPWFLRIPNLAGLREIHVQPALEILRGEPWRK